MKFIVLKTRQICEGQADTKPYNTLEYFDSISSIKEFVDEEIELGVLIDDGINYQNLSMFEISGEDYDNMVSFSIFYEGGTHSILDLNPHDNYSDFLTELFNLPTWGFEAMSNNYIITDKEYSVSLIRKDLDIIYTLEKDIYTKYENEEIIIDYNSDKDNVEIRMKTDEITVNIPFEIIEFVKNDIKENSHLFTFE